MYVAQLHMYPKYQHLQAHETLASKADSKDKQDILIEYTVTELEWLMEPNSKLHMVRIESTSPLRILQRQEQVVISQLGQLGTVWGNRHMSDHQGIDGIGVIVKYESHVRIKTTSVQAAGCHILEIGTIEASHVNPHVKLGGDWSDDPKTPHFPFPADADFPGGRRYFLDHYPNLFPFPDQLERQVPLNMSTIKYHVATELYHISNMHYLNENLSSPYLDEEYNAHNVGEHGATHASRPFPKGSNNYKTTISRK
ncbi:hypothetical protein C0J52_23630 [Blattella germanica]|nr:hypothetical protein C0J52_23630 [Blattella germanica]